MGNLNFKFDTFFDTRAMVDISKSSVEKTH